MSGSTRKKNVIGRLADEVLEWYSLSPAERFEESLKLWEVFVLFGGRYDLEPIPKALSTFLKHRPLLRYAIEGKRDDIQKLLREEEDRERELDRQYWAPLKDEIEAWRHQNDTK